MSSIRLRATALTAAGAAIAAVVLIATVGGGGSTPSLRATDTAFTGDPTFGLFGNAVTPGSNGATGVAVVPGGVANAGSIMVSATGNSQFQVARFTSAGALDPSFGGGIAAPINGAANAVTVVPAGLPGAGDVVAVGLQSGIFNACGTNPTPVVAEFLPNGTLNNSFGSGGVATVPCPTNGGVLNGVAIDPAGNIDVAGVAYGNANAPSMLIDSFGPAGTAAWNAPVITNAGGSGAQANSVAYSSATGDVVAAGWANDAKNAHHLAVVEVTGTGALDTAHFNSPNGFVALSGQPGSSGNGVVVVGNGNVVVAGTDNVANGHFLLQALSPTGAAAAGFGFFGQVDNAPNLNTFTELSGLAYQSSTNLLSAAGLVGTGSSQQVAIVQYNASTGAVNGSFGSGGVIRQSFGSSLVPAQSSLAAVAVQPDGKTVAAGQAPVLNAVPGLLLMRVFGPVLSVLNAPLIKVTSPNPATLRFPVRLSEPLAVAATAAFCASPGATVNGQGQCGTALIPAGATSITVSVQARIMVAPGHSEAVHLQVFGENGLAADPTHSTGTGTIQRLNPPPPYKGYWMVASDGGIFAFGNTHFFGSTGNVPLVKPIVGMTATPKGDGYWLVASDGGIFAFGKAHFYGSTGAVPLTKPIVGMAATPDGRGYWLVASDGGIFAFGDAHFYGSTGAVHLNRPIVGMAATPDGGGYWLVASDGGIFAFGDASFHGSTGNVHLNKPIVAMAAYPGAGGYWMVASDGGIFSFGAATFHGSTGAVHLTKPIVGMAVTPDGGGYWLVASDGGIFAFGDARFYGSTGKVALAKPIVGMFG